MCVFVYIIFARGRKLGTYICLCLCVCDVYHNNNICVSASCCMPYITYLYIYTLSQHTHTHTLIASSHTQHTTSYLPTYLPATKQLLLLPTRIYTYRPTVYTTGRFFRFSLSLSLSLLSSYTHTHTHHHI